MGNVKDSKKNFNHKMNMKAVFGQFFCPSQRFFDPEQVTNQSPRFIHQGFSRSHVTSQRHTRAKSL